MTPSLDTEVAVRRELLHLALKNSTRSVPLQLIAVAVVVAFGVEAGAVWAPIAAAVIGLVVAVWRYSLSRRYGARSMLAEERVAQATWELEGNSILAGLLWVVCSFGIYPLARRHARDDLCRDRHRVGRDRGAVHVAGRPIVQLAGRPVDGLGRRGRAL